MKVLLLVVALIGLALADEVSDRQQFSRFLNEHRRLYANEEVESRFRVFQQNLRVIEQLNEQNPYATFGVTEYADLSSEEFIALKTSVRPDTIPLTNEERRLARVDMLKNAAAPYEWSWVAQGKVPPVVNQGSCGSCWAFSAAEAVSSVAAVQQSGPVYQLAPQEFVDCDRRSHGCSGGWPHQAFMYMIENNRKVAQESYYPYHARQASCYAQQVQGAVGIADYGFVSGSASVAARDGDVMNACYAYGILSVAIDATAFQHYSGGVITNPSSCGGRINHAVNIVGYATDSHAGEYWLVKNSWGSSWGEGGFGRIARGYGTYGICQINTYVAAACARSGCN
ncbi:hypothetical protein GEMRC1_002139 [Eukaryota sp. GEM-RC1]